MLFKLQRELLMGPLSDYTHTGRSTQFLNKPETNKPATNKPKTKELTTTEPDTTEFPEPVAQKVVHSTMVKRNGPMLGECYFEWRG